MKQPELGNKIVQLRKAKGLTQEELVERCNISVRTIQRIETGEVNPRSYTVKTILSALESNFDELHAESGFSKQVSKTLTMAWISGIVYFVLGFLEGAMDLSRIMNDSQIPDSVISEILPVMEYGPNFYLTIKILVVISYVLFMRGFAAIGAYTNNSILTIVSKILIGVIAFAITFDIFSFFYSALDNVVIQVGIALSLGALSILFGIALLKLRLHVGAVCVVAGVVEILAGIFFLILNPTGLVIQMLAVLLEIIIVYQMLRLVMEKGE